MNFLRTLPTRRLATLLAGIVAAGGGGTAIALAAGGGGPVPPPKPLASAIHDALAAPAVPGITARVQFTNHLIDAASLQGSDPILQGGSGRLWLSSDGHMRLEVQGDNGDAQAVTDGKTFWVYDPSSTTVYRGALPQHADNNTKADHGPPTLAQVQDELAKIGQHADVGAATPDDVAGQAAYTVRVSPQHDGGLLGSAQLAWDAVRGVPLKIAVYARGSGTPVLELKATDISYGAVPASDFAVSPPPNAKVVKVDLPSGTGSGADAHGAKHGADVSGKAAVAKRVSFPLSAPDKLVGLPLQDVRYVDWNGTPAALVTYGQNLGGIAVIEQPADSASSLGKTGGRDHGNGLSLPSISIGGATGQELDTALGTLVRFQRGGVAYTVLGSVPPAAAEAAARGL
jgi:outer membrane lipoprotein-sorting protein